MIACRLLMVYDGRRTGRKRCGGRGTDCNEESGHRLIQWGKKHYALCMIGGILGIVLLAMILICAAFMSDFMKDGRWRRYPLPCVLRVTALCVGLAYRLGQQSLKNRLIFCLDEEDRLFVVEAGKYIRTGSGLTGYISLAHRTQKEIGELTAPGGLLERGMSREESLTGQEPQIISVEQIREREKSYRVVCRLKYPNQGEGKRTYAIMKGYEDENGLIWELERRRKS